MRKPKGKETEQLQGHPASKWQSQDVDAGGLGPKAKLSHYTHGLLGMKKTKVTSKLRLPHNLEPTQSPEEPKTIQISVPSEQTTQTCQVNRVKPSLSSNNQALKPAK